MKRFEKSIRFRLPITVHRRKTIQAQPKLIIPKTSFMELAALNELKSKYLLYLCIPLLDSSIEEVRVLNQVMREC